MKQQTDYELVIQMAEKYMERILEFTKEGCWLDDLTLRKGYICPRIDCAKCLAINGLLLLEKNLAIMVEGEELEWACDAEGKKYQTKVARPVLLAPILKELMEEMKC